MGLEVERNTQDEVEEEEARLAAGRVDGKGGANLSNY
jgi:hypothetical protein